MRFAAKKLTRSDLTFFEYQYRRQNAGNQKSINLNRNVFVDLIFPLAADMTGGVARQFPVPVAIYGPGMRNVPHTITRKVISKGGSQKNWRLNGEFVPDPDDDRTRYHDLAEGDIAVFGFEGEAVPTSVHIVLLSRAEADDKRTLNDIAGSLGTRSMNELAADALSEVVGRSPPAHPIRELLETERDAALQEAALGSADGAARLLRQPSRRRMTAEALIRAREAAEAAGRNGEALIDSWLRSRVETGQLRSAVWVSEVNAISPWDFEITELSGEVVHVEVKSTGGPFERPLHISQSEIAAAAADGAPRTDIYRVYALSDNAAWLCIARNVRATASVVANAARALPSGVVPDGYSVAPSAFGPWSEPAEIRSAGEDE